MASQLQDLAFHFPAQVIRKKKGQQKKEELEKEVAELKKMLNQEQKVHEFLEKVYQRKDIDSSFNIPNFLPPKTKELLSELAMVEDEIAKLESQISQLQSNVNKEKEINNIETKPKQGTKLKQWPQGTTNSPYVSSSSSSLPPNPNKFKGLNDQKVPFETKALHFISKAIKGDYGLNDFRITNEKLPMKSKVIVDQEENQFHQEVRTFGERISRKSGMIKSASPLREPRNPTPRRERNVENIIPLNQPTKYISTPTHDHLQQKVMPSPIQTEEDTIHRWTPNKLSENIMKCLIFIFIRLLRTSRAMELEKSGPIGRSSNFSMSFRAEPSFMNSKTSNLMIQKDTRQQDPYGIFDSEESIPRDIGPYKNLVRFTSTSMEAKCISNSNSIPLFQKLKLMMNNLQNVDLRKLNYQQKLAFWINMYNACIMHGFLQHGLPSSSSPEKLLSLMNKATLNIGGSIINAHAIEHFILRKPLNPSKEGNRKGEQDDKESIVRELHGLESFDPNVMFALCCGTRSSPAVKIYTSDGVTTELEKSKLEYLQASLIVTNTKRIAMPELLLRNMNDFAQDLDSLIEWICQQLPTSGSLRKSIVDCFRGLHGGKASTIVEKIPYDFEFQYLLSV